MTKKERNITQKEKTDRERKVKTMKVERYITVQRERKTDKEIKGNGKKRQTEKIRAIN